MLRPGTGCRPENWYQMPGGPDQAEDVVTVDFDPDGLTGFGENLGMARANPTTGKSGKFSACYLRNSWPTALGC